MIEREEIAANEDGAGAEGQRFGKWLSLINQED